LRKAFLGAVIVLLAVAGVVLLRRVLSPGPRIFRPPVPAAAGKNRLKYTVLRDGVNIHFKIRADNGVVSVKSGSHRFTFSGVLIPAQGKEVRFENRFCQGACRVSFNYFQPEFKGGRASLSLWILRAGKEVLRRNLEDHNRVGFFSEVLPLRKGDSVVVRKAGGAFALVGRPVFSRPGRRGFVFLIGVDTLRRDSLGMYNPSSRASPHIDRFARQAVVFENAFSVSSWTLPAFTSVFTGLYPKKHGVNFSSSAIETSQLLTPNLQGRFYTAAFTGDFFVSSQQNFYGGFDYFEESSDDPNLPDAARDLFEKVEEVLDLLPERSFLFLHTYQLHLPYLPERTLAEEYYRRIGERDGIFALRYLNIQGRGDFSGGLSPERRARVFRALYDAGVYTFDRRFGEFVEFLKKRGFYRNSTIILFSDHGEEFAEHGGWTHGHTLYNELLRVPLIVKLPGQTRGMVVERNVSIVDIMPTIFRYYGISLPEGLDGVDLLSKEKGRRLLRAYLAPEGIRKGVGGKIAYIFGEYKIIRNQRVDRLQEGIPMSSPAYRGLVEVYDWKRDPGETFNLLRRIKEPGLIRLVRKISRERFPAGEKRRRLPREIYRKLKTLGYN